ncbi:STAS domain-containing protein [Cellulosimicrobium sp. NPDC057127]|uniref:STAS domain-containing protein n=1 Tax=Cellulosimicrobium sp. NPDC057127 TaxID=3346026 RepID=UPI00362D85A3
MKLDVTPLDDTGAVLTPHGRLTLTTAAHLRDAVTELVGAGRVRLVVDLGALEFVDSSGLGALVAGLRTARAGGGDLRLANASEQVATVLRLTNLDRVLRVHDDAATAFVDG